MPVETKAPRADKPVALQQAPPADAETRVMPHALGPEKSILSTMLNDCTNYVGKAVEEALTPEHFYLPSHGILFRVLEEAYHRNEPVELVALVQKLQDRALLDAVGGPQAIYDLFTYAPHAAHFENHLRIVKDKHVLRSVIRTCADSIEQAHDNPEETSQLLDQVEAKVLGIREQAESRKDRTIVTLVNDVLNSVEDLLSGRRGMLGIPTGYPDLDKLTGGLKPAEMFVVAARPSMGKTSLMMNMVEHICLDQQRPCLVFSCEMAAEQLVQRLLFSRAGFNFATIRDGFKTNKGDLQRIKRVSDEIRASHLFLDDTPAITIGDLRAKARRRKRDSDICLIAIDYLQLMRSKSRQAENSREREIAEISAGLKGIAKELSIPIIVLAQLNRSPETRGGAKVGVPRMSDLRESGSIEQDADLIGLLYRADYYAEGDEKKEEEGKAELLLVKNRNGQTDNVPLTFRKELMRFESRARDEGPHS